MIYVDSPKWKKPNGRKRYAHMVADTLDELHKFAEMIGVKRHFFHRGDKPHYDVTEQQYLTAIENNAVEVTSREIVRLSKSLGESHATE